MLTLTSKHPERIGSLVVKKLTASQQANSTLLHDTVLLQIQYDYEVPAEKRHIIFVIDTSSSMEKKDIEVSEGIKSDQLTSEREEATEATEAVIGKMNKQPSSKISRIQAVKKAIFDIALACEKKHINNCYSIISFNKEADIVLDGGDIYDVNKKRHDIKTSGGTSIYHGLLKVTTLESLHKMPVANTVIILLSDGYSTLLSEGGMLVEIDSRDKLKSILDPKWIFYNCPNPDGSPRVDSKLFDAKVIIDRLTSSDRRCPKIFSIGMGIGYHQEYLEEISSATQAVLTHITRSRDFTQMIESEILDASTQIATLAIQYLSENPYQKKEDQEIVLFSGKDKEILVKLDKKTMIALFKNGWVPVKFDQAPPQAIIVDSKKINTIDKNITLSFYEIKKSNLLLNGNISLDLLWDIPHTDQFCNDEACNSARLKLLKTIETFKKKKTSGTLPLLSKASYIRQGYVKSLIVEMLEEEPAHMSAISLTAMSKPTSALALDKNSGRVYVQAYDKDELFRLANLDPGVHTRADLSAKFSKQVIQDPLTRLRLLAPLRDFSREQEMEETAARKSSPLADSLPSSMAALSTDFSELGCGRPVPLTATTQVLPTGCPHHASGNS